jgi:ferric-chelate reductase
MDISSMASDMPGMTMTSSSPSSTVTAADGSPSSGMDMSNATDPRMDLLMQLLDDTELQVISNSYAKRFWYGVVVIIGLAALLHIIIRLRSRSR